MRIKVVADQRDEDHEERARQAGEDDEEVAGPVFACVGYVDM